MILGSVTTPFVSLKVGDMELGNVNLSPGERDPKYFQSMKVTRFGSNSQYSESLPGGIAYVAEIHLSMVNDLDLENKLLNYIRENGPDPEVTFQYGVVGGSKSPIYTGVITKLGLSSDFYTLTMTVTAGGVSSIYRNYNDSAWNSISNTVFDRASDLVEAIATRQGWTIGNIERTKKVSGGVRVNDINLGPYQYINSYLIDGVVSEKGEGSYVSNLVNTDKGLVYYYEPTKFLVNRYNYKNLKSYNFSVRLDPAGVVLGFRPILFDGMTEALYSAKHSTDPSKANSTVSTITRDTKEIVTLDYGFSNTGNRDTMRPDDEVEMAFSNSDLINSDAEDLSTYLEGSIKDDINSYAYSTAIGSKATLIVVGDPDLFVMDYINVIPMYPIGDSSRARPGTMHPSGGTYMILGIVDEISDTFSTTMELMKMNDTYSMSEINVKNADGGSV